MARPEVEREAASTIRAVLDLVAEGDLLAPTRRDVAVVRRLEGAAIAWEKSSTQKS